MPEIKVTKAFNFRVGSEVLHFAKSDKPVPAPADVAQHAVEKGFAEPPKDEPAKAAKPAADNPADELAGK
ncbi:hypothetical protein [Pseudomonas panipatensis]|uniref:Uncharacterized protein n=1 Tax=Pseudomonas panipatensis TaxID=428992 RepID=A0A1G8CWI1_9PSED|nr:hypothetical protein [Pseudomonas panipatensis]SDH49509.1 hypothetical protein SAMN05216272_101792 [Pseudomonas panipatensis]SMP63330.1 hypothetical protein SAMN06295951_10650 [Pseudomonas panipatensis]